MKPLYLKESYRISPKMICISSIFDRHGNHYSLVREEDRLFAVTLPPLNVIDYSIRCNGYNLKSALDTAKWLLGKNHLCPIVVDPIEQIILFPTRSRFHEDNIWFNPDHIKRTFFLRARTLILFMNDLSFSIPGQQSSFNHKLTTADQYKRLTVGPDRYPITQYLVKNQRLLLKLKKEMNKAEKK